MYIWSMRNLSLIGKITILKSLIIPQVVHLFSLLYVPDHILKTIDKLLFSFLWNNKKPKIKRDTIVGNIEDGGLKMPDIYLINRTSKISWIKRLVSGSNSEWKNLMFYMLNIKPEDFGYFIKIPRRLMLWKY